MVINRSAPSATVVPILVYADVARSAEWLCRTFGFSERLRYERDGVVTHAQLSVADGALMLGREGGPFRAPQGDTVAAYVHVTVQDVDAHYERARQHGAEILSTPHDMPFGERQYTVKDPAGHWWTFSQHVADVAPDSWGAVAAAVEPA